MLAIIYSKVFLRERLQRIPRRVGERSEPHPRSSSVKRDREANLAARPN